MSKNQIHNITPIREGMTVAEAEEATKGFLSKNIKLENIIFSTQVAKIETANREISGGDTLPEPTTPEQEEMIRFMKLMGAQNIMPTTTTKGRSYQIATLKDGSQWVVLDKGLERYLGAIYLDRELSQIEGLQDKWKAVETKLCIQDGEVNKTVKVRIKTADESPLKGVLGIKSNDFTCYAKYAGDNKPGKLPSASGKVTEITGYNDFGGGANLREQGDGSIIVIDTEYRSFSTENVTHISDDTDAELGGAEFTFQLADFLG